MIQGNLQNRKRLTDLWLLQGRESWAVWGYCAHTAIFKMDNQQGPTVEHIELCSMLCGGLDRRGVWGRMDTWTCMAESLHCSPESIITLFLSCIPMQNKKLKVCVGGNQFPLKYFKILFVVFFILIFLAFEALFKLFSPKAPQTLAYNRCAAFMKDDIVSSLGAVIFLLFTMNQDLQIAK